MPQPQGNSLLIQSLPQAQKTPAARYRQRPTWPATQLSRVGWLSLQMGRSLPWPLATPEPRCFPSTPATPRPSALPIARRPSPMEDPAPQLRSHLTPKIGFSTSARPQPSIPTRIPGPCASLPSDRILSPSFLTRRRMHLRAQVPTPFCPPVRAITCMWPAGNPAQPA